MLALITELRAALGWRAFVGFLIVAAVSLIVYDFTANGKSWFETVTQYHVAKNADQRQTGEAKDAIGKGAVSIARTPYADELAKQELRKLTAEADQAFENSRQARAGAEKAIEEKNKVIIDAAVSEQELKKKFFDTQMSASQAAINCAIAHSMGLRCDEPKPPAQPQAAHRYGTLAGPGIVVDCATNGNCPPPPDDAGLTAKMTRCMMPKALSGRQRPRPECEGLDNVRITPETNGPHSDALGDAKIGEGRIWDGQFRDTLAQTPGFSGQLGTGEAVRNLEATLPSPWASARRPAPDLAEARANWNRCASDRLMGGHSPLGGGPNCPPQQPAPDFGQLFHDSYRAYQYVPGKRRQADFSNTDAVAGFTQRNFDNTTCKLGINGNCPAEAPPSRRDIGAAYYRAQLKLIDKAMNGKGVGHGVGY